MGMSFKPSEMSSGGGLWADVNATISKAQFILTDFDGRVKPAIPAFELVVVDDNGVEYEQLLSCGKGGTPSDDGDTLEGTSFNINSNFGQFMVSLVGAGFPENRLDDKAGTLIGTKAHFDRVAAPKRAGLVKQARADGRVYEDTILVVTKILKYPWEKAGAKMKAPAAKSAPSNKGKAAAADSDVESVAGEAVLTVLSDNPEGLTKQQLAVHVFNLVKASHPNLKAEVVKLINTDGYYEGKPWTLEDGVVTL